MSDFSPPSGPAGEALPATYSERQRNIAATNLLLDVLGTELGRPDAVISDQYALPPDEQIFVIDETGALMRPPLAEIPDPDNPENSFEVGVNAGADAFARIVRVRREKDGLAGRIAMDLRRDMPAILSGWDRRHSSIGPYMADVKGELASSTALLALSDVLPRAFDARRSLNAQPLPPRRVTGLFRRLGSLLGITGQKQQESPHTSKGINQ